MLARVRIALDKKNRGPFKNKYYRGKPSGRRSRKWDRPSIFEFEPLGNKIGLVNAFGKFAHFGDFSGFFTEVKSNMGITLCRGQRVQYGPGSWAVCDTLLLL